MESPIDIQGYALSAQHRLMEAKGQELQRDAESEDVLKNREAARAFEAYFVEAMLKEMRKTIPKTDQGDGQAMEVFQGLFDGAIASRIAEGPGIGMADVIERSMGHAGPRRFTREVDLHLHHEGVDDDLLEMGRISSSFGARKDPFTGAVREHKGLDIALPAGTPVEPVEAGRVVFSGVQSGYGQVVVVDHGEGVRSVYAHLQSRSVDVGQEVGSGTVIGRVGSSGRATGPHLHLEIRRDGVPVDPETYLGRSARR